MNFTPKAKTNAAPDTRATMTTDKRRQDAPVARVLKIAMSMMDDAISR
jgi:hypothetical protein